MSCWYVLTRSRTSVTGGLLGTCRVESEECCVILVRGREVRPITRAPVRRRRPIATAAGRLRRSLATRSMRSAARTVPDAGLDAGARHRRPAGRPSAGRRGAGRSRRSAPRPEAVGREPTPEAGLVDPLGVVDLVPEQRQHDHRLAVVERLGDGVVAAVGDDEVDLRQDRRLRQEPLPVLLSWSVIWSASGPSTRSRGARVVARTSTSRCMSPTSAEPSDPSER